MRKILAVLLAASLIFTMFMGISATTPTAEELYDGRLATDRSKT